jgi:hypothetical protein
MPNILSRRAIVWPMVRRGPADKRHALVVVDVEPDVEQDVAVAVVRVQVADGEHHVLAYAPPVGLPGALGWRGADHVGHVEAAHLVAVA